MPSRPRRKGIARAAAPADVEAAEGRGLPDGASLGQKPSKGLWYRLLGPDGQPVTVDGTQVRVP